MVMFISLELLSESFTDMLISDVISDRFFVRFTCVLFIDVRLAPSAYQASTLVSLSYAPIVIWNKS